MNCFDMEELFDAYLDGQLGGGLRLEFDAHRVRCQRCQQSLAMLEAVEHVVASDRRGVASLSADFTDRLMERIAETRVQPVRKIPRWVYYGAAALQAAALIGFFFFRPQPTNPVSGIEAGVDMAAVEDALRNQDRVGLHLAILQGLDTAIANVGGLAQYASSISSLPGDASELEGLRPFELLLPGAVADEKVEPVAPAGQPSDVYSL